jgi:hypothetical protein
VARVRAGADASVTWRECTLAGAVLAALAVDRKVAGGALEAPARRDWADRSAPGVRDRACPLGVEPGWRDGAAMAPARRAAVLGAVSAHVRRDWAVMAPGARDRAAECKVVAGKVLLVLLCGRGRVECVGAGCVVEVLVVSSGRVVLIRRVLCTDMLPIPAAVPAAGLDRRRDQAGIGCRWGRGCDAVGAAWGRRCVGG